MINIARYGKRRVRRPLRALAMTDPLRGAAAHAMPAVHLDRRCRLIGNLQAQKTNNPDLVAPLLADSYVTTGADGKLLTKEQALAAQRQRKYSSVDYEDVRITVYGSTAIATGVYKGKGTEGGKAFDEVERWTDTWVKMPNGKWQCVADHNAAISK